MDSFTHAALCAGTGDACTANRCDGDELLQCEAGRARAVRCSEWAIAASCRDGACAPAPSLACNPLQHQDRCESDALVYCDGAEQRLSCAALGLSTCSADGGAHCL